MSEMKAVGIGLMLVVGLAACGRREDAPALAPTVPDTAAVAPVSFKNTGPGVSFVGDAVCADCHEDEYHGFQAHGMAHSFYELTPDNAVEDFEAAPVYHPESGYYYRPFAEGGQYYQEEYRLGSDGKKTHRLVRRIRYVVGSGTAARTYLTESGGWLYEMPLTWYTQKRVWDLSPGYRVGNKRFDRRVGDRCMACHNSYPTPVAFTNGKYTEVPLGIGCERCHGPGSLHVDERLADPDPPGDVDPTIVNPAHLPFERRLDVCGQCHLNTTVSVLREGRTAYDFRPSQALADYVALFAADVPPASDQISVISHADRMKRSACFRGTMNTARPLECVTCHDPHAGFRDQGPEYFNRTCRQCHAPEALATRFSGADERAHHAATANCIQCHMPRVEAEEAPHSSFTDHWIRVVGAGEEPVITPASGTLVPYFARDREGVEGRRYAGIAYVVRGRQTADTTLMDRGIALLKETLAADPDHGEAQYLLGFALLQRGRLAEAIPPLEAAVRLDPDVPERLNTLAQAYEADGRDPARIARLYARALHLQPALAGIRLNYGRFLETRGRPHEALNAYQAAVAETPWMARAQYNLGTAYLRQGDYDAAEAALKKALELDPLDPEARGNLGLLYATQGRDADALAQFEAALAAAPNHPVALGNLGTYYLNHDDLTRALDLLGRAVAADAQYVDGLANLALAYFRNDDMGQAEQYARRVLDLVPGHPLARQILAAL